MSSLSIFSTLEEVIPVSDEDLRAGIGSLTPQIVTEYVFYLRNVERKNRAEKDIAVADKDVAVAENVRLEIKLETLQKEMDRDRGMPNDHAAPPSAPPQYDALPDLPTPSFGGLSLSAAQSSTSPNEQHGCLIQAIDGPAAGCALTHNSDPKNEQSYWVHTQPTTPPWGQDKWKIILTEVNSQKCYNIKATTNQQQSATKIPDPNTGRMLVVLNDNHGDDGRALVHDTPHSKANECWMIEYVNKKNKSFGCRIRKTQDRQKDKYLVSRRQRDMATFWVDVTENIEDATWWQIFGQQPQPLPFGDSQPSSSTNRPVVQIEINSSMKEDTYIFKIFNKKYHGPLCPTNDLGKGKYKLALVNERHDYEDGGKELIRVCGPRLNRYNIYVFTIRFGEFGTLLCNNNMDSFAFRVEWQIQKMSDGAYMIINAKTGQALKCDDAKDGRGNHQVRAIKPSSNDENDGSNRWIFQLMITPVRFSHNV
ncbi:uncharacterized protein LOC134817150 [Bolinopsis microptera]|uniref:uncharacterized protein LOC134817150 n=1 Tax=Bolinopsis microptera TaxID=2820187 RepID=UPI00307AC76F